MRAIWITRYGPPEVMEIREGADISPAAGEVKIRVHFIGINFSDLLGRMGCYRDVDRYVFSRHYGPGLPYVPGYEVSGTVEEVGPDVADRHIGERVVAVLGFGAYADTVCVPAESALQMPSSMSLQEGAALPVNYLTAYHPLFHMTHINPGERVLVHAAAGGVGLAAIQLCKIAGAAKIYGSASTAKLGFLRDQEVYPIDYTRPGFAKEINKLAKHEGFDIILDPIGGEMLRKNYDWLAPSGRLIVYGSMSYFRNKTRNPIRTAWNYLRAPAFNAHALIQQTRSIIGVGLMTVFNTPVGQREMNALLSLFQEGKIKPHIGKVFPFEEVAVAHHYIHDRKNIGKVLLAVQD